MSTDSVATPTPVHRAETRREREAVYRFRYRVYLEELGGAFPEADHAHQWLMDDEDEKPSTAILYTGTPEDMTGTIRTCMWGPGEVPATESKRLSLTRFPGIEGLAIAETGRFMVQPGLRGSALAPALVRAAYEHLSGRTRVELVFCWTAPSLLRLYRQIGFRPYGARLVDGGAGAVRIPLVIVLSDEAHLKRCGSPLAPLAKQYFGAGQRPPLDTAPFRHVFEAAEIPVETDPDKVWRALTALDPGLGVPSFLTALAPDVVKRFSRSGFLLTLRAGETLLRQGTKEPEVYVILDGVFEVLQGRRRIAVRTAGDLIGEIAFFTQGGARTASVRAMTDGRVLVLRRKFLQGLTRRDPEAGYRILMAMGRVMAERLAEASRALAAQGASED